MTCSPKAASRRRRFQQQLHQSASPDSQTSDEDDPTSPGNDFPPCRDQRLAVTHPFGIRARVETSLFWQELRQEQCPAELRRLRDAAFQSLRKLAGPLQKQVDATDALDDMLVKGERIDPVVRGKGLACQVSLLEQIEDTASLLGETDPLNFRSDWWTAFSGSKKELLSQVEEFSAFCDCLDVDTLSMQMYLGISTCGPSLDTRRTDSGLKRLRSEVSDDEEEAGTKRLHV